jgi:hypothetical protein
VIWSYVEEGGYPRGEALDMFELVAADLHNCKALR